MHNGESVLGHGPMGKGASDKGRNEGFLTTGELAFADRRAKKRKKEKNISLAHLPMSLQGTKATVSAGLEKWQRGEDGQHISPALRSGEKTGHRQSNAYNNSAGKGGNYGTGDIPAERGSKPTWLRICNCEIIAAVEEINSIPLKYNFEGRGFPRPAISRKASG